MNILDDNYEAEEDEGELTFEELCNVLDATCRHSGIPPIESIAALELVKHSLMHEVIRITTVNQDNDEDLD